MRRTSPLLSWAGAVLLAVSITEMVLPARVLAASLQIDRLRATSNERVQQVFENGSRILLLQDLETLRESVRAPLAPRQLSADQPLAGLPPLHLAFESSLGERLHLFVELLDRRGEYIRFTVGDLVSMEVRLRRSSSGQLVPIEQWLIHGGDRVRLSADSATDPWSEAFLERALLSVDHGLSEQMKHEIRQVASELMEAETSLSEPLHPGRPGFVSGELRSRGALDCTMATIGYLGSFLSFSACAAIIGCLAAVALHYAAIYGAVTACVDWIREDFADRLEETEGGDGGGDDGGGGDGGN